MPVPAFCVLTERRTVFENRRIYGFCSLTAVEVYYIIYYFIRRKHPNEEDH